MLPVIDIAPLVSGEKEKVPAVAREIAKACRENGFFYIINHGVDATLMRDLETASREFFSLPETTKQKIAMVHGGRAWRGYFTLGGELTSGIPDLKEGIYFGDELSADHKFVKAGYPLHGANLFPAEPAALKPLVLRYLKELTALGHCLMKGLSLSLGLPEDYFARHYTDPALVLFRIFHYPPSLREAKEWGVGEHTDYGVLTILKQDDQAGLEVKTGGGWVKAPPLPGTFICNIGDMLDRLTGGLYRSTPHRVKNLSGKSRLSFPFFFDPNFEAPVKRLPIVNKNEIIDDRDSRWDKASVHTFEGTYGDYLLGKVSKVFPELHQKV